MPTLAMRAPRPRGLILFMLCAIVVLLTLSVAATSEQAVQSLRQSNLRAYERQACAAAEHGLQQALVAIRTQPTWSGFSPAVQSLPTLGTLSYQVIATNNSSGSAAVTAPDGTTVPAGSIYLRSTGTSLRGTQRTVTALVKGATAPLFVAALWGDTGGSVAGNASIDAYNSSQGSYSAATRVSVGAPVGTNATTAKVLSLGNNTQVDGNLYVGPNAVAGAVSGATSATGTVQVRSTALTMPVVTPPTTPSGTLSSISYTSSENVTLSPGTYGDLNLGGQAVLQLRAGTYHFAASSTSSGNISLSGSGQLILADSGPVTIYFDGAWSSTGSSQVNPTGTPGQVVVYGSPSASSVSFQIGSGARLAMYAPSASIKLGGSTQVFGSLMGSSFAVSGGSQLHYDTSLATLPGLGSGGGWALTGVHRW